MKILGTDFDNTLYFWNNAELTAKNVEAAKRFVAQGNILCIITGRTYMEIKQDLAQLNLPYTYLVCADGALIFDSTDYCLKTVKLDQHIVERAVEILRENGYDPYLEDGYNITKNSADCIKVSSLYASDKNDGARVAKLISDELKVYTYASRRHVNVNNPLNDKKQAIYRLAEVANLDPNEFHLIGDDINDYEMLETFNKTATVKNHNPILDNLHLPVYETFADYIDELLKK